MIAIGNGTASRETEALVRGGDAGTRQFPAPYAMVSEAGASVYSASEVAREEFPDLDATERGNISIARRLQDPLAELVKIDPKALGVGLYQHDVDQKELAARLGEVVESAVNYVGVDVNTASASLLTYVAGVNPRVAKAIVAHRDGGRPLPRPQGAAEGQGARPEGLRAGGRVPAHPRRRRPARQHVHPPRELPGRPQADRAVRQRRPQPVARGGGAHPRGDPRRRGKPTTLAELTGVGVPTLADILENLDRPGRDPRDELPPPILRADVLKLEDLAPGMVLKGTVRNVVDFGAFVDIGVKQDGLVHVSELSARFVKSPLDVVQVGDQVEVRVLSVDVARGRIALSMRPRQPPGRSPMPSTVGPPP